MASIRECGFSLPAGLPYDGAAVPFAYPPLALYLGALAQSWTPLTGLEVLRWLPLLFSVLTVPAVVLVARRLTGDAKVGFLAGVLYALIPSSYEWLIMGAGLTRSEGILAVLLTLSALSPCFARGRLTRTEFILSIVGTAAVILSHPEAPVYLLISATALWLGNDRTLRNLLYLVMVAGSGVVLAAPWLLLVISRHGIGPFLSAMHTSSWALDFTRLFDPRYLAFLSGDLGLGPLSFLSCIGIVYCFCSRRWGIGLWIPMLMFFEQRGGGTMVTVAMALVAAIVLVEIIGRGARQSLAPSWAGVFVLSVLAGILVVTMGNNLRLWTRRDSPLKGVTQGERAVMEWIRENTPSNARFLVLDGATRWAADRYAEWFPVLSNRVSVATVKGHPVSRG